MTFVGEGLRAARATVDLQRLLQAGITTVRDCGSYTALALFVACHAIGAHSTYSEVPYERWFRTAFSWIGVRDFSLNDAFGFERNHYDRLVHFVFGLLFVLPVWEVSRRYAGMNRWWSAILTFSVIQAASLLYEIAEWLIARRGLPTFWRAPLALGA